MHILFTVVTDRSSVAANYSMQRDDDGRLTWLDIFVYWSLLLLLLLLCCHEVEMRTGHANVVTNEATLQRSRDYIGLTTASRVRRTSTRDSMKVDDD